MRINCQVVLSVKSISLLEGFNFNKILNVLWLKKLKALRAFACHKVKKRNYNKNNKNTSVGIKC